MNVTQFLQRLSYGPLSNLSMAGEGDGTIIEAKQPAVVQYLNDALLDLYGRFNLSEKELVIELDETINNYRLSSAYALTTAVANPANPHYIIDSAIKPFTDDLIQVLRVYVSSEGSLPDEIGLNDDNDPDSVFTPQHDLLQVPDPVTGTPLYVIYQAMHPQLVHTTPTDLILLPPALEPALFSFVAHKIFFDMGGQDNLAKSNSHFSLYEKKCLEVQDRDLVNASQSSTSSKFSDRGFR